MKLFTVFFIVLLVGLSPIQLGDACGGAIPPYQLKGLRVSPFRSPSKMNNGNSEDLEIILPQKGDPKLLSFMKDGARRGFSECQLQRINQSEPWNCPLEMYNKLPLFDNKTFLTTTREIAFIQAISAAAITHEITHQCTQNKIPGCGCPRGADWGICDDDILFGMEKSRRFTDRLENPNYAQTVVSRHNNEVGREVVRTSAKLSCRCHGFNTACTTRTCWKKLAPFEVVASKLKEKYSEAMRVRLVHKKLWDTFRNRVVSVSDQTLVYLDNSPSICQRNDTLGYPGILGRSCRSDVAEDKCKFFIESCNGCNLRVEKVQRFKRVNCNCKFIYCCKVECDKCMEKYSEITCNALKAVETDIVGRSHP